MTVQSGRVAVVKACATTSGSYVVVGGITGSIKVDGWDFSTAIDTTQMGDVAARGELSGFYGDIAISFEMTRIVADAGQVILYANNPVWIQYAADGSTFKKIEMLWTPATSHAPGAAATSVSVSMKSSGGAAPAAP